MMLSIREWLDLKANDEEADYLVMDGYDDCLVGVVEECGCHPIVVYDRALVIEKLAREMGHDDAWEFHNFNQTSQPGIGFLDRPGPLDGVMIRYDCNEPWWLKPAQVGVTLFVWSILVALAGLLVFIVGSTISGITP